jgi:hypothetical protein
MKRSLIIGLVVANVVLLAALTLTTDPPKAYGQAVRGSTDYLVTTGHFEHGYDAIYMIDLGKRKMCYFLFDRTNKRMQAYSMRKLRVDFPATDEER